MPSSTRTGCPSPQIDPRTATAVLARHGGPARRARAPGPNGGRARAESHRPQHVAVLHPHPALADRTHGELGLEGHAQLAHHDDVERRPQRRGHLVRHRHPASGKPEHHGVPLHPGPQQGLGQLAAGVRPVEEPHGPSLGAPSCGARPSPPLARSAVTAPGGLPSPEAQNGRCYRSPRGGCRGGPGGGAPRAERPPARQPRRRAFRKDIEGLRAVAILAVVLYHAHVGVLSGGYVGVDVFFVISGYLITDHLWKEVRERRHALLRGLLRPAHPPVAAGVVPRPRRHGARHGAAIAALHRTGSPQGRGGLRALRRQLPLRVRVTPTTSPRPPRPRRSSSTGRSASRSSSTCCGRPCSSSRRWRGARRPSRFVRGGGRVGVDCVISSFVFSVWLTNAEQPWAFFSLPSRAWELAVGGLVALGAPGFRAAAAGRSAAGLAGLAAVAWSVFAFTSGHAVPGHGGAGTRARRRGHHRRRLRSPGRPRAGAGPEDVTPAGDRACLVLVVPVALADPDPGSRRRRAPLLACRRTSCVATLSLLVAVATFVLVERPVRISKWLTSTAGAASAWVLSFARAPSWPPAFSPWSRCPASRAPATRRWRPPPCAPSTKGAAAVSKPLAGRRNRGARRVHEEQQTEAINQQVARSLPSERRAGQPRADPARRRGRRTAGVRRRMPRQLHRRLAPALRFGRRGFLDDGGAVR